MALFNIKALARYSWQIIHVWMKQTQYRMEKSVYKIWTEISQELKEMNRLGTSVHEKRAIKHESGWWYVWFWFSWILLEAPANKIALGYPKLGKWGLKDKLETDEKTSASNSADVPVEKWQKSKENDKKISGDQDEMLTHTKKEQRMTSGAIIICVVRGLVALLLLLPYLLIYSVVLLCLNLNNILENIQGE
ncbi:MAG: hypothetical protein M1834_008459 [Cirrosporium novae-zelandiae]|nr:MAG: hypothetical protein M1834_008459 [Cirrosporium novae-zelandiae]